MSVFTWIKSLLFVSTCGYVTVSTSMSSELRLYEQLTMNYSSMMRPVTSPQQQVIVNISLEFHQLLDLDEKREVIESVIWIEQQWYDNFLRWNPADHDDIQVLVLPSDVIWVPDLYVLNLVGDADNIVSPFLSSPETLNVRSNGKVGRVSPYRLITSCSISLHNFPFDSQSCVFILGSWAYTSSQLHYEIVKAPVTSPEHMSSDWDVTEFTGRESVYPYGEPVTNYSLVLFTLGLKRRPLYHITYLIIPSLMLNLIVSVSFFLPAEAGERVSLGLTSFLAYSVFIMMMADKIPESTQSMPMISILFLLNMALTMVTILWSVFAIRIHYRASIYGPPPSWLLRLAIAIESRWCSIFIKIQKPFPEENIKMLTQIQLSPQGIIKTTSLHDVPNSSGSLNNGRNSHSSYLGSSRPNSMDLEDETLRQLKNARQAIEEGWHLIMCAADRTVFCLFMLVTIFGLVLVFIAKSS